MRRILVAAFMPELYCPVGHKVADFIISIHSRVHLANGRHVGNMIELARIHRNSIEIIKNGLIRYVLFPGLLGWGLSV
jgi:hypothetical protein